MARRIFIAPERMRRMAMAAAAVVLSGCAGVPPSDPPQADDCTVIALSSNGWHAGFYLPAAAFGVDSRVRAAFPDADWLAVGWGEVRAYPGPLTPGRAAAAIAWPTGGLVHVSAHGRDPRAGLRQDHLDLAVSSQTLDRLAGLIEAEITGPPVAPGLARESAFFPARTSYHALRTCNVWLAQRLELAGIETGWTPGHLLPGSLLRAVERRTPRTCPAATG